MKKEYLFLFLISTISFASAVEYPKPYDYYVNDYASLFTEEETAYLQDIFNEVFLNTTAEVVIVTIPTLNGSDISQYAVGLANDWKVGKNDKDNGVVILYALEENRIFVATGYGVEGILPDSKLGRMLDTYYVPLRDEGNVTLGILVFSSELKAIMLENREELLSGISSNKIPKTVLPIIIGSILIFFFLVGIISYFAGSRRNRGMGDFTTFLLLDIILRSVLLAGKSSSSGGFGGSFGGFGGGSFGGGGAGR